MCSVCSVFILFLQRSVHHHPNHHYTARQNHLANSDSQLSAPHRGQKIPRMQRLYVQMQGKSISSKVTEKGSSSTVCMMLVMGLQITLAYQFEFIAGKLIPSFIKLDILCTAFLPIFIVHLSRRLMGELIVYQ